MTKFMIPVPGKFPESQFGKNYYSVTKSGDLAIVGIKASDAVKRRYSLWFTEEMAIKQQLDYLPREWGDAD